MDIQRCIEELNRDGENKTLTSLSETKLIAAKIKHVSQKRFLHLFLPCLEEFATMTNYKEIE